MFDLKTYLIKEHVGLLKLSDTYDIFDPESGEQIGVAKEEPSVLVKVLRFLLHKRFLPTSVSIYGTGESQPFFRITRGITFLRSKVYVRDPEDKVVGYFQSKLLSLGGGFYVYDPEGKLYAEVKGDWKGWNFKIITAEGEELGTVTKKWAGFAKELFTSADNYVIALNERVEEREEGNMLLLAAGLAIDIVYKEH